METRANFILIGAFTLAAILGTLGFFIWLASFQIDRQYQTYGILFEDVSGLDSSGDVLFNGIRVGRVIDLQIYDEDPSRVFATVEVDAETPVRENTVARLQSQGVTGVSYISLSGGTPGAEMLRPDGDGLPIIPSQRSTVQSLVEDAPGLVVSAGELLAQLRELVGPENRALVNNILRNLDSASAQMDQALADFSDVTGSVSDATLQIARFTDRLDSIGTAVEQTLARADTALAAAERTFGRADTALDASVPALERAEGAFAAAETVLAEDVPALLAQLSQAAEQVQTAIADLQDRSGRTIDGFGQTAVLMNLRLVELERAMLGANTAFTAVTEAADSFDILVDGDGTLLVAEARDVLADAKRALTVIEDVVLTDVPPVVADIREAVATASRAVDRVAQDITGATARLTPLADDASDTLRAASDTFARAGGTLAALDRTLAGADTALGSAADAFDTATGLMETDIAPVLDDIRTASGRISAAVEDVTRDVPAIAADLRALIARADSVVGQVQGAVAGTAPGLTEFADRGLPALTRLGDEARALVNTLNGLARRIERDPGRFLLDNRVPEYRR
ncbi:phospholipid/cholesterol/gamma-HCH transport system substrate-binding protein [Palleronia salina]|uniref:Phospholipid/cholesterol/gamma-HCH transport system substrate-binding protein n=1 Tax=Palleronia salina TaxID=313368 RepID=A0A1M6GM51_9RHOB|nr:MlaD family protein [Palleronia salina]SHJ10975.1 phospholipid/cholesterol/gamma-HCH transport system substrate-binding protein [Palleronia salina]